MEDNLKQYKIIVIYQSLNATRHKNISTPHSTLSLSTVFWTITIYKRQRTFIMKLELNIMIVDVTCK